MLLAVIFSAIAGSFFNMLVYRLNNGVSLFNPANSICPKCRERLHWFELIPAVSFLFLRGRCASCGEKIPAHYLLLEIAFIVSAIVLSCFFSGAELWRQIILSWLIWGLFFSDILYQEIPYTFSAGLALWIFFSGVNGTPLNLLVWLILFALIKLLEKFYYRRPAFGGADFLLLFLSALYFPWPQYVLFLYLTFFSGLFISLGLLIARLAKKDSLIPFVPFILLGFVLTEYAGESLLKIFGKFYGF